jgi:hypothetical protein
MLDQINITCSAKDIFKSLPILDLPKTKLNNPTGDFFYDAWQLKDEFKKPAIVDLFTQLGSVGEARIIVLEPGESYCAHADIDDRYHLTLQGEHSYLYDLKNLKMYPTEADNTVYLMDAGRIHSAANLGYKSRIQLVVRKLLNKVELKDPCSVKIIVNDPPYNLRYLFDHSFSIVLNRLNKQGCMNKFKKISETEISFEIERTHLPQVNKLVDTCGFNIKVMYDEILE